MRKRFVRVMGSVLVALFLVAGCENVMDPDDTEQDSPTPEDARLDINIFTLDAFTPAGGVELVLVDQDDPETEFDRTDMVEGESTIENASLWQSSVSVEEFEDQPFRLVVKDSEGNEALGLRKEEAPWWREIDFDSDDTQPYETIDEDDVVFLYQELIRHWEDGPEGSTVTFEGNVSDGEDNSLDGFSLELIPFREVKPGHWFGYGQWLITEDDNQESESNIEIDRLRLLENEEELPLQSSLDLRAVKNFHHDYWTGFDYSELYEHSNASNGGKIDYSPVLFANRIVSFDWIVSEDGIFSEGVEPEQARLNTIGRWDFQEWELADFYYDQFAGHEDIDEYRLDELNAYWFDEDARIGVGFGKAYSAKPSEFALEMWATDHVAEFAELESDDFPPDDSVDVSNEDSWESWIELDEESGQVIAMKADAGYALVRITDVTRMTQDEMQDVINDYEESTGDESLSLQSVTDDYRIERLERRSRERR